MVYTTKPPYGTQLDCPLNRGLDAFWVFNEGIGDKVYDLSGNENTGTLTNMAFPSTPISGWSPGPTIKFDGVDDFIGIPNLQNSIGTDTQGTISAIVNISSMKNHAILTYVDMIDTDLNMEFFITSENKLKFTFRNNTSTQGIDFFERTTINTLLLNTFYRVSVVSNGLTTKLYINETEQATTFVGIDNGKWFGNLINTTYSSFIGKFDRLTGPLHYLSGAIDEVRIWNRALSDDEFITLNTNPYIMFLDECQSPICNFMIVQ